MTDAMTSPGAAGELASLTWPEVAERAARTVLVLPLGSTEQHGPHLPLSTDTDIAVALSERLAAAVPHLLVAPPVHYGSSGEHRAFAGTLSIGQDALAVLLVELCRSADAFAGVVIVSTHGGNAHTVHRAVDLLQSEGRKVMSWSPHGGNPSDTHAGLDETSVQLALRPGSVRRDSIRVGSTRPLAELMPELTSAGVEAVSPSGVLGDPTESTASLGNQILDRWADDLIAAVRLEWDGVLQ